MVDFLLTDTLSIALDDNDISVTGDSPAEDTLLSLNHDNQQVHKNEESLCGKLVINVPFFSASDLCVI